MNHSKKLGVLEVGRAFAALAVVLSHADLAALAFSGGGTERFQWGAYGVDFFFVLSGFIIYHVNKNNFLERGRVFQYAKKRIQRIYIPYIPVSIAMIMLYVLFPSVSQGNREWGWLTSLTLIPSDKAPALSVAWTLVYEMIFYTAFMTFFLTKRFVYLMLLWVVIVVIIWISGIDYHNEIPLLKISLNPLILEFIVGMLIAYIFNKVSNKHWPKALTLGIIMIILYYEASNPHRVLFGLSLAPIVLAAVMLEQRYCLTMPNIFIFLGAASYAIYIVHNPVQSIVARLIPDQGGYWLSLILCFIVGTGAGIIYHILYERRMLSWFKSNPEKPEASHNH